MLVIIEKADQKERHADICFWSITSRTWWLPPTNYMTFPMLIVTDQNRENWREFKVHIPLQNQIEIILKVIKWPWEDSQRAENTNLNQSVDELWKSLYLLRRLTKADRRGLLLQNGRGSVTRPPSHDPLSYALIQVLITITLCSVISPI
jgi:hypothetical protein